MTGFIEMERALELDFWEIGVYYRLKELAQFDEKSYYLTGSLSKIAKRIGLEKFRFIRLIKKFESYNLLTVNEIGIIIPRFGERTKTAQNPHENRTRNSLSDSDLQESAHENRTKTARKPHSDDHNSLIDSDIRTPKEKEKEKDRERHSPPAIFEIELYFLKKAALIKNIDPGADPLLEAQKFDDYYTANGWKIGRNPIKSWEAAARNWINKIKPGAPIQKGTAQPIDERWLQ